MNPVSFVRSLEIEDSVFKSKSKLSTPSHGMNFVQGKDQAAVDAGSLVSFVNNLTSQNKEDVLNGTMLAQLAASKKYDRYQDPENWFKFYLKVMENIGWVMQELKFNKYQPHQSSFKISQIVLVLLESMLDNDPKKVLQDTIKSLEKSSEGLELFGEKSSSSNAGNFQVLPCSVDKSGQVTVAFLGSHFKAKASFSNYFFFTWSDQSIDLFYSAETITLNEGVYSQVRQEIIKKLGSHAKDFVHDLPI